MSLYNTLHGVNPVSVILLKTLGLEDHELNPRGEWPTGRFRDIYLSAEGDKIILLTRNGGGNRDCWDLDNCENATSPETHDHACLVYVNWKLTQHPLYIMDYDNEYDYTYAHFEFKVPEDLDSALDKILKAQGGPPKTLRDKFTEVMDEMESMSKEQLEEEARFKPFIGIMKKISEARAQGGSET